MQLLAFFSEMHSTSVAAFDTTNADRDMEVVVQDLSHLVSTLLSEER
jgi:hypothetical protein